MQQSECNNVQPVVKKINKRILLLLSRDFCFYTDYRLFRALNILPKVLQIYKIKVMYLHIRYHIYKPKSSKITFIKFPNFILLFVLAL